MSKRFDGAENLSRRKMLMALGAAGVAAMSGFFLGKKTVVALPSLTEKDTGIAYVESFPRNASESDDTGRIQRAINSLAGTSGGEVWFGARQYIVGGKISIPYRSPHSDNKTGIRFCGKGSTTTVIKYTGKGVLFDCRGKDDERIRVSFSNLQLQASKYSSESIGIHMEWNQRNSFLENVDLYQFGTGVKIRNNWNLQMNQVNTRYCGTGIDLEANAILIEGGEHLGASNAGIRIAGGSVITLDTVTIETSDKVAGEGNGIEIRAAKKLNMMNPYFEDLKGSAIRIKGAVDHVNLIGGRISNDKYDKSIPSVKVDDLSYIQHVTLIGCQMDTVDLGGKPGNYAKEVVDVGCWGTKPGLGDDVYVNAKPLNRIKSQSSGFIKPDIVGPTSVTAESNEAILNLRQDHPQKKHKFITFSRGEGSGAVKEVGNIVISPQGKEIRFAIGGSDPDDNQVLAIDSFGNAHLAKKGAGLTLLSPNGTAFQLTVDNSGELSIHKILR